LFGLKKELITEKTLGYQSSIGKVQSDLRFKLIQGLSISGEFSPHKKALNNQRFFN